MIIRWQFSDVHCFSKNENALATVRYRLGMSDGSRWVYKKDILVFPQADPASKEFVPFAEITYQKMIEFAMAVLGDGLAVITEKLENELTSPVVPMALPWEEKDVTD